MNEPPTEACPTDDRPDAAARVALSRAEMVEEVLATNRRPAVADVLPRWRVAVRVGVCVGGLSLSWLPAVALVAALV